MPARRIDPSAARLALQLGASVDSFCREFDCHPHSYYRLRARFGFSAGPIRRIDPAVLRRMILAGASPAECRRHFDCSRIAVFMMQRQLGLGWRHKPVDRAEWADWEDPKPGPAGVVPLNVFADIYRERGCVGTAHYLGISPAAVSQRAARLRAKGVM